MTPEQSAWESLRPVLLGLGLDPKRVENVVGPGHPDVDYAHGNIELKALPDWPARATTDVKVPHFTGQQAGWLYNRWQAGGLAWLMVRVAGKAWFLFDGETAMAIYRGVTRQQWHDYALLVYSGDVRGGLSWGASPPGEGQHSYSKMLGDWLTWNLKRMMPANRERAVTMRPVSDN